MQKIQKYRTYILEKSSLSAANFNQLLDTLFKYIRLVPADDIKRHWDEAKKIMEHIDPEDVAFIAAALSLDTPIWSDDKHFERQSRIKVTKTRNLV